MQVIKATECNNEGALTFGYSLEDTDYVGTAEVYNGQNSVLWKNVRDGFASELRTMYTTLRSGQKFNYATVAELFTDHQSVWPEAMWNEDAFLKYLQPYLTANENYLAMLQGNKASQRDWWLFNRFRYLDSKYRCGDASSNFITLRCYAVGNITLTPYADIYARVRFGSYDTPELRATRNQSYEMVCGLDQMNDTEVYIYSSDRISSVGDLSHLQVGLANFSMAPKLREIKLGDEDSEYENTNLGKDTNTFDVGSNELLETVNIANCSALGTGTQKAVDLSGCTSLKTVIATGTNLRGITLPNGGHLTTLKLPATLTNFTVLNQTNLQTPIFEGYGNLETLRIENTPNIQIEDLILENPNLNRVRLVDVEWDATDAEALQDMYDVLSACGGIDADGNNTTKAVVSGIVSVSETVPQALLDAFMEDFPDLTIVANGHATLTVRFRDWDGTLLNTQTCDIGGSVNDPVAAGTIQTPTREPADKKFFTYSGWDKALTNITHNMIVTAVYSEEMGCEVRFVNADTEETLLYTAIVRNGATAPDPVALEYIDEPTMATDAQYVYTYIGWDSSLYNITQDKTVKARYATDPSITVTFVNWDDTVLAVRYIASGANVTNPVTAGEIETPTRPSDSQLQINYVYSGWNKSLNNITEDTTITASFNSIQYYIITFKNPDAVGGTVLYTTNVNRNGRVIDPVTSGAIETPTRYPEATYNYIYKGWDAALSTNVTSNLTYTATYKTDRQFSVSFVDWDGTRLDTQLVADEDAAVDPVTSGRIAQPARASTAQYTYAYNGWDNTFNFITADTTITAQYTSTVRTYSYRFLNNDNTVLKSGTVDYGTTVTPPSDPSYSPADEDMEFTGWNPSDYTIVANTDFIAQYVDNSAMTVKYLKRTMTDYESDTATAVADYAFYYFESLETVRTSATSIGVSAFFHCTDLTVVDLTSTSGGVSIYSMAFNNAWNLEHLIIRSSVVATLYNVDAFTNTLLSRGLGAIYVPTELVEDYKAATNWSTFADHIYPISLYPVTDFSTISDSWAEIFEAEDNGTYTTKYHVGDTKLLDVGDEYVYMIIAGIDTDTLADNTGNAKITWIADRILTSYQMNSTKTADGGWQATAMRDYLRSTVLHELPSVVQSNIKEVNKYYTDWTSGSKAVNSCADTIWIPSYYEINENYSYNGNMNEEIGACYNQLFSSNTRIRYLGNAPGSWWLRSANANGYFGSVLTSGGVDYFAANNTRGVVFGFCT